MKKYFIDTNVLIDNPDAIQLLSDSNQNEVLISYHVLNELDKLKKDPKLNHIVSQVVKNLKENIGRFKIITSSKDLAAKNTDEKILQDILSLNDPTIIFITKDNILQLKAQSLNILCEEFKRANPFVDTDNGGYTGIFDQINEDTKLINNCFYWDMGKLYFYRRDQEAKSIHYTNSVWKVQPKNYYQNAFFELGLCEDIDLFTIQGAAGTGKTFLSLALAFHHVLEKKNFKKIYITKAMYEIGQKLGYLPGDINEKMAPYMKYIESLLFKLNELRTIHKIYGKSENEKDIEYNNRKFEILPINFVRGMDLEDSFIIIDETQNLSRSDVRTLLSRMGENVKCICIGDITQIDNPYLDSHNNGLNWIMRNCKGEKNYAHLTIKSDKYRGPICELVVKTKL